MEGIDEDVKYYIKKRPGLDQFLEKMSEYFKVIIFTNFDKRHCEELVSEMDRQGKEISLFCY